MALEQDIKMIRLLNDDPRCQRPEDCGLNIKDRNRVAGVCQKCRSEARQIKPERALTDRWCPDAYKPLYRQLKSKVGSAEARRLTQDQIAVDDRRIRAAKSEAKLLRANGAWNI